MPAQSLARPASTAERTIARSGPSCWPSAARQPPSLRKLLGQIGPRAELVANRLIVHGFLADGLARIPVPAITDHLGAVAGAMLERSDTSIDLTRYPHAPQRRPKENDR